jgi:hypothetical protein
MQKWQVKLRIMLWIILAGIVGWLLYMGVVPSGKISYFYDFTKPNYFIKKLTPEERVKPAENGKQVIIGNPAYFFLRTPRRFNKATLTMKYKNYSELPVIETGVLADKIIWRYDLKPVENKIIDQLSLAWDTAREGEAILLQRDVSTTSEPIKKYGSIQEFLDDMPPLNEIAIYNYDLEIDYILEDYKATELSSNVEHALRGSFQFYTYIKDEGLDFTFEFQDLNKNKERDDIDLFLYYNDQLIDDRNLNDDGISEGSGEMTDKGELDLKLVNLPEGVYKLELKANNDIVTKSIKTKQQKLSFINKIWISDAGGENIKLYSDSGTINAQTINPGRLQKIKVNSNELDVDETYKQFSIKTASSTSEIILEKDDIIISGNGIFSFDKEGLINPKIKKVDENLNIANEEINYIIANYNTPREEDEWRVSSASFDLSNVYREFNPGRAQHSGAGKYSFIISIPGFNADDEIDDSIEISEISFDLQGTSLIEKIKKFFYGND